MATVRFTEPITLQAPPRIAYAGCAKFGVAGDVTVALPKAIQEDYLVVVTGRGENAGALAKVHDTFSVIRRSPESFVVQTSNSRCRQTIDFIVVIP